MPGAARKRIILKGDVPSPINPPKGCRFHTRCPYAFDRCRVEEPALKAVPTALDAGHVAACHLHDRPEAENPLADRQGGGADRRLRWPRRSWSRRGSAAGPSGA